MSNWSFADSDVKHWFEAMPRWRKPTESQQMPASSQMGARADRARIKIRPRLEGRRLFPGVTPCRF